MRKRTLGAVLLAGLALSGAGAFTASNNMTAIDNNTTANSNVAGYGTAAVTGATVTAVHYNIDGTDQSKVDSIVFTATGDLTAKTAQLKLTNSAGAAPTQQVKCVSAAVLTNTSITCTFYDAATGLVATPVSLSSFDGEALTVSQ